MSRKTQSRRERERDARSRGESNPVVRWLRRQFESAGRDPTAESASHVRIPAAEFAERHGFRESAVVSRIRKGIYDGVEAGGEWFVLRRSDLDANTVRPAPDASVSATSAGSAPPPEIPPMPLPARIATLGGLAIGFFVTGLSFVFGQPNAVTGFGLACIAGALGVALVADV